MDRRNFLGLIAAGAAMQVLPALATEAPISANAQIWTAETLTLEMEKMFACRMGPAAAVFDMVMGVPTEVKKIEVRHPLFPNAVSVEVAEPTDPSQRYAYQTFGFAMDGGEAWEAEHRLAKHFYDEFSKLDTKNLVWRRKPQFETQEITEYGEVWLTSEQVEDGHWRLANWVDAKGRERVRYDPTNPLEIPEGVELDFNTGDYRYVTRKYPLHRMTMRLAFTDRQNFPVPIARLEGEPLPRIS